MNYWENFFKNFPKVEAEEMKNFYAGKRAIWETEVECIHIFEEGC